MVCCALPVSMWRMGSCESTCKVSRGARLELAPARQVAKFQWSQQPVGLISVALLAGTE